MIRHLFHQLEQLANGISTKPNIYSWRWKGQPSILAFILLYIIYMVRLFSLLQILKKIYRVAVTKLKSYYSIDKESKRVNVPPIFVELYFIGCCIVCFLINPDSSYSHYISAYFLIETTVWVLYYHIFRRFYEERYAIMHSLEYLVTLPVVILIQSKCIAILENDTLTNALISILNPNLASSPYICLLSILYTAIIFGIIITNLPLEKIKESNSRLFYITILGAGDVVQNRLLPAIKKYIGDKLIVIFDPEITTEHKELIKGKKGMIQYKVPDNSRIIDNDILNSHILWIATPSHLHLKLIEQWIERGVFIVVEKPIISLKSEQRTLEHFMASNAWNRVFSLSYYYLEKALPLTYLFNPYSFYEKYLSFNGKERAEILGVFANVGKITDVELFLFEQQDNRTWLADDKNGGQYLETFIHLALLNHMIFGIDRHFTNLTWKIGDYKQKLGTYIECHGKDNNANFHLYMGKFMPEKKRCGRIVYEEGILNIDFENSNCSYLHNTNHSLNFTISLNNTEWTKYGVQLDMVRRCYKEDIIPSSIDGSKLQIETLKWLFDNKPSKLEHFSY